MESIFLILSGVILAAGVLYWFWSHIQLTQKKVQLLENAVFELRGMMVQPIDHPVCSSSGSGSCSSPVTSSVPVYADLPDDEDGDEDWPSEQKSTPLEELTSDDLQPGGRIDLPAEATEDTPKDTEEKFRELFIQHEHVPTPKQSTTVTRDSGEVSESLDAMPVKELRRLAEQRGLTGVSDMKKKELLSALRQQVVAPAPAEEERTLNLTLSNDLEEATVLE